MLSMWWVLRSHVGGLACRAVLPELPSNVSGHEQPFDPTREPPGVRGSAMKRWIQTQIPLSAYVDPIFPWHRVIDARSESWSYHRLLTGTRVHRQLNAVHTVTRGSQPADHLPVTLTTVTTPTEKNTQISQGGPPHCPAGGGDPSLTCWGGSLHPYSSIARPCFVQPGVKPLWGCAFDHALKQGISSSTVCHEYNAEVLSIRYS